MSDLRTKVIRLAHSMGKGEGRTALLSLLAQEAAHFSPGDILVGAASGKGESVHVSFFQVMSATAQSVVFREIEKKNVSPATFKNMVSSSGWKPIKDRFTGSPKRKKIRHYHGHPSVEVSYGTEGMLWDGKTVFSQSDDRA